MKSTKTATYTFGGYYTVTGGSVTQYYTTAGVSARTWDKTDDTTLYAKWTSSSITTSSITAKTNRDVSGWSSSNTLAISSDGGYPVNWTYTPTANGTRYAWYISSAQALADTYWWSSPGYDTSYTSGKFSIFRNNLGSSATQYDIETADSTTRINKYGVGTVAKDKWFM